MIKIGPKVRPLWLWSQKVLPLVYDDSLSYYEVICKLTAKVNEIIAYVQETVYENVEKLVQEYFVDITYDSSTETINMEVGNE